MLLVMEPSEPHWSSRLRAQVYLLTWRVPDCNAMPCGCLYVNIVVSHGIVAVH